MAISNFQLNVTANTNRALADFQKFSRSLDNKFLVSGLKLDVIRSTLNQINRDFQRAIGEQGLASAASLRAAQNQAALLTQTFKGFAYESSLAITNNIGTALNTVAIKAGGTMRDVQKTLAATPFISTRLSEDLRTQLATGILSFQRDMRRAGLGNDFSSIAQQFLMGRATGMQLIESGSPIGTFLGSEIIKKAGGEGQIYDPMKRSQVLADIINSPETQKQLREMAKRSAGFTIVLEDLNTKLFNPETGIFGSLRNVVDKTGKQTNMFAEVEKLVLQVFGPKGMFASLVKAVNDIFGIGDPLRPFIDAVQFVTKTFRMLTDYFNSSGFREIVIQIKVIFDKLGPIFKSIFRSVEETYRQITSGNLDSASIVGIIVDIGNSVREYIKRIGKSIRDRDDDKAIGFVTDIGGTLLEEIGKTTIVLIRELFATLVDKVPEITSKALPAINRGINNLLEEAFGGFGVIVKGLLATMPGPIGAVARASIITDATGGQGGLGLLGAAAPFLLRGGGGFGGAFGRAFTGTGAGATAFRTMGLGLMGMDPIVSLLGGFAPQMLGGMPGIFNRVSTVGSNTLQRMNAMRMGFLNSPLAATMSGYLGGIGPLGRSIGGLFNSGAATVSGYLGGVGPLGRSLMQPINNQISRASVFLASQRSQFMAGYRPLFPHLAIGAPTTPAGRAGQFFRNLPSNASNILSNTSSFFTNSVTSFSNSIRTASMSAASSLMNAGRMVGANILGMGRTIAIMSSNSLLEIQRAGRMFMLGAAPGQGNAPIFLRNRPMVRAGMAFRSFGGIGMLAGGGIVAASQLAGNAIGGDTGQGISGVGTMLGGAVSGASAGAVIGSAIPVIGTAAGALIGGIIGGVAPLMDKGVRDGVGKFIESMRITFMDLINNVGNGFKWLGGKLQEVFRSAVNGVITALNYAISSFTLIPRIIIGGVEELYNRLPVKQEWATQTIQTIKSLASYQIPRFASGKNSAGPSLAMESRMSGHNAMIVNDSEFVIPRDGFLTLSGLVANQIRNSQPASQPSSPKIDLQINLQLNSLTANSSEIINALRDPVIEIINAAWTEANQTTIRRARVS